MPDFTISVTDKRRIDGLLEEKKRVNAHRANQTPAHPPMDNNEFIQYLFDDLTEQYAVTHESTQKSDIAEAWRNADDAKKAEIKRLLGL